MNEKKVMVWCSDESMELRLTNEINSHFKLSGIVVEKRAPRKNLDINRLVSGLINKFFFYFLIDKAWIKAQVDFKKEYKNFPKVPVIFVDNINSKATLTFCQNNKSDLVVVSGTALVKRELLSKISPKGIINLHTGLSPYIKGGPNCTNWCLSERKFHAIGNTVMWLDEGIDSGNVIHTKLLDLESNWTHSELLRNVIIDGQNIYIKVIESILKGEDVPSVPQKSIAKGVTYYNRQWGFLARIKLIINFYFLFKKEISSSDFKRSQGQLVTIKLH